MTKPMYEFFASYDIYHMIRKRNECAKLKRLWMECKEKTPNECSGQRHCSSEFKKWLNDCHSNPKVVATVAD